MTTPSQDPYRVPAGGQARPAPVYDQGYAGVPGSNPAGAGLRPRNGLGVAALVLGILAVLTSWTVVGGCVLGVGAIVLGVLARGRARRAEATNGGVATAGIVTGVLGLLLSAALIAFGATLLNSSSGKTYTKCVKQAAGTTAALQQCARQFQRAIQH